MPPISYQIFPVGVVRSSDDECRIEINPEFEAALKGLSGFSHITVLYWFHQNDTPEIRSTLQVRPRKNPENPITGVFATHSPARPNLIATTPCKIIRMDGLTIHIDEIDARDGSPVIDIKPYIPIDKLASSDDIKTPKWVTSRRG
jgi:tRNA-Thr(GGU) m(6)t(6)A37 methyltransferase TsaA